MTLQDIKKTKRYGRTDAHTHRQRENSIPPPQTKFAGGIITERKILNIFFSISFNICYGCSKEAFHWDSVLKRTVSVETVL